jgi:hypothetical protein
MGMALVSQVHGETASIGATDDACADQCQFLPTGQSSSPTLVELQQQSQRYDPEPTSTLTQKQGLSIENLNSVPEITIDRTKSTADDASRFLADGQHIGTVGQGRLADAFASDSDSNLNTELTPIAHQVDTIQSARSIPVAVPLPRTWELSTLGLLIVAGAGSKLGKRILN